MTKILYDYQMNATTWVYLSSLIMIAVYFKFRRFWSVRNLDLIGLIFLAPGLLLVAHGKREQNGTPVASSAQADARARQAKDIDSGPPISPPAADEAASKPSERPKLSERGDKIEARTSPGRQMEQLGYLWLFVVGGFFLFRMLIDSVMVRRPLLEPNLSASGLSFACASMFVFLIANVITDRPEMGSAPAVKASDKPADKPSEKPADKLTDDGRNVDIQKVLKQSGPGYPLFHVFSCDSDDTVKRITAIIAHLAIVLGMVLIGYRHFDNTHAGIAAATLYLLLPYTAQYTPRVDHVVPGALLVWAIQCYRRPVLSGIFVGLAAGLTWYPLFLLPLWCSFYWRRGLLRFSFSVLVVLSLIIGSLAFAPANLGSFWIQFMQTVGAWYVPTAEISGFWEGPLAPFRWPIMAAFFAMCGSMVLWPAQKNLGSLLACSAAIMLGTQFWKAHDGGTYMAWFLPLMILTILRPNLEDRVALSAISEGWVKWRK